MRTHHFYLKNKKPQHLKQPLPTIFSVQENTCMQYFAVFMTSFSDDDAKELLSHILSLFLTSFPITNVIWIWVQSSGVSKEWIFELPFA